MPLGISGLPLHIGLHAMVAHLHARKAVCGFCRPWQTLCLQQGKPVLSHSKDLSRTLMSCSSSAGQHKSAMNDWLLKQQPQCLTDLLFASHSPWD